MAEVVEPPPWLLRSPRRRIAWVGSAVCVGLLAGIWVGPPVLDAILGFVGIAVGAFGTWAYGKRRALDELPLVLGDVAVRQAVDGHAALRVRTWLGHGRRMRDPSVDAALIAPSGQEIPLRVELPAGELVGPLTVTAYLPALALGEVRVAVEVQEGGRTWTAARSYPTAGLVPGPLDVPVRREGRRLAWQREAWDRPMSESTG